MLAGCMGSSGHWATGNVKMFFSLWKQWEWKRNIFGVSLAGRAAGPLNGGGLPPRWLVFRHHPRVVRGPRPEAEGRPIFSPQESLLWEQLSSQDRHSPALPAWVGPETRSSECKVVGLSGVLRGFF